MNRGVLALDLTQKPALLQVAVTTSTPGADLTLEVAEQKQVTLNGILEPSSGYSDPQASGLSEYRELLRDQHSEDLEILRNAVESLETPWYDSLVLLGSGETLSLNLNLPFKDPKQIERIVSLEVQDEVPFDIEDFQVATYLPNSSASSETEVHISLAPKELITKVLALCQEVDLDPQIICANDTALASFLNLAPKYFAREAALIGFDGQGYSVVFASNGSARCSTYVQTHSGVSASSTGSFNSDQSEDILRVLKLAYSSLQNSSGIHPTKAYVLPNPIDINSIQKALGCVVEALEVKEFVKNPFGLDSLATVATTSNSLKLNKIFANFRCGELSYSPQLSGLLKVGREIRPYFLTFFVMLMLSYFGLNTIRNARIDALQAQSTEMIKQYFPESELSGSATKGQIDLSINNLRQRLEELASFTAVSPLKVLHSLSQDLNMPESKAKVYQLQIKDNRINIKGSAPRYSDIDQLKATLEKIPSRYCSVEFSDNRSNVPKGNRGFELKIEHCPQ